jgi:hypothetical protein|tara:strand:+ start:325 stop:762 length:438 start_codon:yes stop_codon:yes gene_type:complete
MIFLRSILITSFVSILFGFAFHKVLGFWESLSLAFVTQFVISFIISSLKINKVQSLTGEFEAELQQLLDLNEVSVPCPCGNYVHKDNIFMNLDNSYFCEKCNNEYKLSINVTPTLLTEPVNVNQSVEELTKDIKITSEYKQGTEL